MSEPLLARYWCHMCSQMVNPIMDVDMKCPRCSEGFLEEMESSTMVDLDSGDLVSDRALSLSVPVLLGMMNGSSQRRRFHRREEYGDELGQGTPAALLQLFQGIRANLLSSESNSSDGNPERGIDRIRDSDGVILINPFNQAIILPGVSLGDNFIGADLDMLLQHLTENDPSHYGTPPAQKEAVEAMLTVRIEERLSCPVCLEEFEFGSEAKQMPCNHRFHSGCILPWLDLHSSCPVCRFQMPADRPKDSDATTNSSERNGNGGSDDGENGSRFWLPFQWPFNRLFSSSGSRRNNGSGSSSSSSPRFGNNPIPDEN